ncbi:MAG: hypothetical protein LC135_06875 [Phycisphaerae bacterium]|nr:hypothetical protein [Phycisphaerae bacterium]MCZ2399579.1 hypothetical protein [Phycisphaerae bacterium]
MLGPGLDRPIVLMRSGAILAALVLLIAAAAGYVGRWLDSAAPGPTAGLIVLMPGVALWIWPAGTMDDWLKLANPAPGAPSGAAYAALLPDYLLWALVVIAAVQSGRLAGGAATGSSTGASAAGRTAADGAPAWPGWTALVLTAALSGALVLILSGPRTDATYRGQVYFALALGFYGGGWAASRLTNVRAPLWYLPAPFLVGVFGSLWALYQPALPGRYAEINIIPANGLVRALPSEIVSVGSLALMVLLRGLVRKPAQQSGAV